MKERRNDDIAQNAMVLEVGYLAKKLFPGGIDISTENFMKGISDTKNLLKDRKPLFEAGIHAVVDQFGGADQCSPALPIGNNYS